MILRERLKSMRSGDPIRPVVSHAPLPYLTAVENECGTTYCNDKIYIDYHGRIDLKQYPEISADTLRFLSLDRNLQSFSCKDAVFLDIETTGTAGGTGTYAFLAGLGFLEEGYFQVRQYFLHDLAEEAAFLHAIQEFCSRFKYLVTYNGKCFDSQILRTRYLMHRREDPLSDKQHIDMLFIARRLWKQKFVECNLVNLERGVLDFQRMDDIPGYMIPGAYTDYLRFARAGLIQKVIHHNQWDILSLAVLMARACGWQSEENLSPEEHFSLSKLYERHKQYESAIEHQLLAWSCESGLQRKIALHLTMNLRRVKNIHRIHWLVKQSAGVILDDELCRRLCILCEHDLKDYPTALRFVESQIQRQERFRGMRTKSFSSDADWNRRKERLQRKIKRVNEPVVMELAKD